MNGNKRTDKEKCKRNEVGKRDGGGEMVSMVVIKIGQKNEEEKKNKDHERIYILHHSSNVEGSDM